MKERTRAGSQGMRSQRHNVAQGQPKGRGTSKDEGRNIHRRSSVIVHASVLLCSFALMSIAGCGEKEAPSVRQSRAIAAENIQLQKDLERSNARIENIKKQYDKELERQRKLLEKCQKEREDLREKSRQNVRDQVKGVLDSVMADNTRLRQENVKLKAQIEKDKK